MVVRLHNWTMQHFVERIANITNHTYWQFQQMFIWPFFILRRERFPWRIFHFNVCPQDPFNVVFTCIVIDLFNCILELINTITTKIQASGIYAISCQQILRPFRVQNHVSVMVARGREKFDFKLAQIY